ncbi:MAG: lysylphosphatidylglycerol synthase domain-containing protein [Candidatus Saccharimonadales bacterium]
MKQHLKQTLALLIIAATVGAFIYYFKQHPEAWRQLGNIPPLTLVILFLLYICFTGSIALILLATVALCNIRLPARDGVLLTMWSSIINFFGPLQSGPAFRAVYLKKAHNVSLKTYGVATLLYYGFYAVISGLFLISGLVAWYVLVGLIVAGIVAAIALLRSRLSLARKIRALPLQHTYKLALATFLQLALVAVIYTIELKSVNPGVSIHQAIVYTGAANFALFVSITPGAIGFREAFLVFSEKLHHISPTTIFAANLIDRALYVSLLGGLFLVAISIHAQARLTRETTDSSVS